MLQVTSATPPLNHRSSASNLIYRRKKTDLKYCSSHLPDSTITSSLSAIITISNKLIAKATALIGQQIRNSSRTSVIVTEMSCRGK